MRTPRLPVVDGTNAPADLNGLVCFAGRRNLVSTHVPPHFKRSIQGIIDHRGVILEVEWEENCVPQVERLFPVYHKTDVLGVQTLRDKYGIWANSGSSVEEIRNNFKEIVSESIERFVPYKILGRNPDPEY